MKKSTIATSLGIAMLSLAAACGGSSSGSTAQVKAAPAGHTSSSATLTVQSVPNLHKVLVDVSGMTVYTPEQEASGRIVCTGSCTTIWLPVTVPAGSKPVAGSGVTATLATVKRADGTTQVTAAGRPLYTFSLDKSPGSAGGNGATDSFDGTHFTWHAVAPSGAIVSAGAKPAPTPSSSSGGYGSGYSY